MRIDWARPTPMRTRTAAPSQLLQPVAVISAIEPPSRTTMAPIIAGLADVSQLGALSIDCYLARLGEDLLSTKAIGEVSSSEHARCLGHFSEALPVRNYLGT